MSTPVSDGVFLRNSDVAGAASIAKAAVLPPTYDSASEDISDCPSYVGLHSRKPDDEEENHDDDEEEDDDEDEDDEDEDDSSTSCLTDSLLDLPSVEKMPAFEQCPGIPHYRLILSIDRKIEAATYQTPFGPVIVACKELTRSPSPSPASPEENGLTDLHFESFRPSSPPDDVGPQRPAISQNDSTGGVPCLRSSESPDMVNYQSFLDGVGHEHDERRRDESMSLVIEPLPHPETFRNRFFEVRSSATAGFGAFALRNMTLGQTILIEKALFHATYNSLYDELEKLEPSLMQAFGRMHANIPKARNGPTDQRVAIFKTNSFATSWSDHAVFLTASRFNHACKPVNNVTYLYDRRQDSIVFSAEHEIKAGEELFICYGKDPVNLYNEYGFVCNCGGCRSLTEDEVHALDNPIC